MRKPQFTRGGTLIMSSPNIIDTNRSRRPPLKRTRTLAFRLNKYNNNPAISLFQARPTMEWKNIDTTVADTAIPATDALQGPVLINGSAQGTGNTQHAGRKLTLRSVQFRFHTGLVAGQAALNQSAMRVIIIYDRNPQGVAPALADIFDPLQSFIAIQNLGNSDRFLMIMDRVFEPTSATSQNYGEGYRKISLEQNFTGAGATIASISQGALWLIYGWVGAAAAGVVNFQTRVRFTDS